MKKKEAVCSDNWKIQKESYYSNFKMQREGIATVCGVLRMVIQKILQEAKKMGGNGSLQYSVITPNN